jgi:hypothetical protein
MAKYFGVNFTLNTPGPNAQPIPSGDAAGDFRMSYDEYTTVAGILVNDTIDFGRYSGLLRPGDRIISAQMVYAAMGAGVLFALGDDGVANRFITAQDVSAAGSTNLNNFVAGFGWQVDIARPLRITVTGAAPTAGRKVQVTLGCLRA